MPPEPRTVDGKLAAPGLLEDTPTGPYMALFPPLKELSVGRGDMKRFAAGGLVVALVTVVTRAIAFAGTGAEDGSSESDET